MITDVTLVGTLRHRRTPSPVRWRNLYCECITFIQPWMMAESTAPLFGQTSRYEAKIVAYGIMQNVYIPFGFVLILLSLGFNLNSGYSAHSGAVRTYVPLPA